MKFKPHFYQRIAIQRLLDNPKYGLLLGMGLGKTIITLSAIAELMYNRFEVKRVLLIAPKQVTYTTWQDEAIKFDHTRPIRFSLVVGDLKERKRALESKSDVFLVNRENVSWLCEYYNYDLPFDMLVLDEGSSFKNPRAKRFRALKRARLCFDRVVLLTGTPAPNSLLELWPQLYLLDGGERLGRTITQYRNTYFKPDKTNGHIVYSYRLKDKNTEQEIYRRISTICMSLVSETCIALPGKRIRTIRLKMPEPIRQQYKKMVRDLVLQLGDETITALNAASLSNKLLQLANGCVYDEERAVHDFHDGKLQALRDVLQDKDGTIREPALVFYSFLHDKERILNCFPEARELKTAEDIRDWNAGRIKVLLAHPASCGYGINLQAGGRRIVWYGLTWSLEQYQQANARLYRQGQTETVDIYHLVMMGTIDEQVMAALQSKKTGQDALLEAVQLNLKGEET